MSKTRWIRWDDEERFKLEFGARNNNWKSVELTEELIEKMEEDHYEVVSGMYLSEVEDGIYDLAGEGDYPAYPILEPKTQFDNLGAGQLTVSVGSVPAFTKEFEGTPEQGDYLRTSEDAILEVTEDQDEAIARCLGNQGDYIKIQKLI